MTILLVILHVIISLLLIGAVLLQSGKGAEMGASFGSTSSQTIFGSRGPGGFLSKLTTAAAILFFITSLSLAFIGKKGGGSSVIPRQTEAPAPAEDVDQTVPVVPAESAEPTASTLPAESAKPGVAPQPTGSAVPSETSAVPSTQADPAGK